MTEPADAGGHTRASAAEDKTYRGALRRTIMMPETDKVLTTHARTERHKEDTAARKLESHIKTRAAEKASREHDLAKSHNVTSSSAKTRSVNSKYTAS